MDRFKISPKCPSLGARIHDDYEKCEPRSMMDRVHYVKHQGVNIDLTKGIGNI